MTDEKLAEFVAAFKEELSNGQYGGYIDNNYTGSGDMLIDGQFDDNDWKKLFKTVFEKVGK